MQRFSGDDLSSLQLSIINTTNLGDMIKTALPNSNHYSSSSFSASFAQNIDKQNKMPASITK
ncbi:MAG: hypothetical protein IPP79_21430 [Chitinophagaceae bacterium]|nr:hypothetical protein [Chitinophagaceae bacterium]